ncbi:BPSS1780 family membrane protein [Roseateles chitinivorans]|uniref:BPSS1780 family membrane protein n=1 Tax=Roseateles chitinivorans TaxID=2917965 RepID=UPI003D6694FA
MRWSPCHDPAPANGPAAQRPALGAPRAEGAAAQADRADRPVRRVPAGVDAAAAGAAAGAARRAGGAAAGVAVLHAGLAPGPAVAHADGRGLRAAAAADQGTPPRPVDPGPALRAQHDRRDVPRPLAGRRRPGARGRTGGHGGGAGTGKPDPKAIEATMADPSLTTGIGLRLLLTGLISIPFWHAPALIHWGGQGVMQALFSSTLGVWRNKGAFALSGLVWVGLTFGATMALTIVGMLLGLANLLPFLLVPLAMILTTAFYCSLYFTFIDCFMFGAPKDLPETPITPV